MRVSDVSIVGCPLCVHIGGSPFTSVNHPSLLFQTERAIVRLKTTPRGNALYKHHYNYKFPGLGD